MVNYILILVVSGALGWLADFLSTLDLPLEFEIKQLDLLAKGSNSLFS